MKPIRLKYKTFQLLLFMSFSFLPGHSQSVNTAIQAGSPRVKVTVLQDLQLGAFTQGPAGGTMQVLPDGSRTASGSVVPLNLGASVSALVLEIEGPKGAIISMLANETVVLNGSAGGRMQLKLRFANPAMPFILANDAPAKQLVAVGAELIVGNAQESPPGTYAGSLNVSFIVE